MVMNTYDPGYHSLREQIEALLTETRLHSRQVAEWQKVEMYWLICPHMLIRARPTVTDSS